jgi:hypothetical protein
MELLGDMSHVEPRFGLLGDRVSVSARELHGFTEHTTGSEIILDEHDGTAR